MCNRDTVSILAPRVGFAFLVACLLLQGCAGMAAREIGRAPGSDSLRSMEGDIQSVLLDQAFYWQGMDGVRLWGSVIEAGQMYAEKHVQVEEGRGQFRIGFGLSPESEPLTRPLGIVLLLHSWRQSHQVMLPMAARLSERGYRSILVDFRGHGYSGGEEVTFGIREVSDLQALLDQLEGKNQLTGEVHLLGVSMGASTALRLAAKDDRVASTTAIAPYDDPGSVVADVARIVAPWRSRFIGRRNLERGLSRVLSRASTGPEAAYTSQAVSGSTSPVLLIHGEDDRLVPARHSKSLNDALACSRLLLLPNSGGHVLSHVRVDWLDTAIIPFMHTPAC